MIIRLFWINILKVLVVLGMVRYSRIKVEVIVIGKLNEKMFNCGVEWVMILMVRFNNSNIVIIGNMICIFNVNICVLDKSLFVISVFKDICDLIGIN